MLHCNQIYFEEVIKPTLIKMAQDGTLPLDLNELRYEQFPKRVEFVCGWSIADVHTVAKNRHEIISDEDAEEILGLVEERVDMRVGVLWDVIEDAYDNWFKIKGQHA